MLQLTCLIVLLFLCIFCYSVSIGVSLPEINVSPLVWLLAIVVIALVAIILFPILLRLLIPLFPIGARLGGGLANLFRPIWQVGRGLSSKLVNPRYFNSSKKPSFRPGKWLGHFQKHVLERKEFSYKNSVEYLRGAQSLFRSGKDVKTFTRANGDKLFYKPSTNEFGVIDKSGNIRTYFRPDNGMRYWLQQIGH